MNPVDGLRRALKKIKRELIFIEVGREEEQIVDELVKQLEEDESTPRSMEPKWSSAKIVYTSKHLASEKATNKVPAAYNCLSGPTMITPVRYGRSKAAI